MKNSLRALIVLAVFCFVAWFMYGLVTGHTGESGVPSQQIRLAGAMAGLFTGAAASMLVSIFFLAIRRD